MARLAADPEVLYPGMPSVAYCDPAYVEDLFWRGPTWLNIAYFAIDGLDRYGYHDLAMNIKETILGWCDGDKRCIFETYNSRTGEGCNAKNFGWSSAFIIQMILRWNTNA